MRNSLVALAVVSAFAALGSPAAAQKKAPPAAHGPAPAAAQKAAPVPAPPKLDANVLATRAGLDAAGKARVAPHVAAMNTELAAMHTKTAQFRKDAPKAEQDRMHAELSAHYKSFDKHWSEATAGMTAQQKAAFDQAVRDGMGVRKAPVGNPHSKLPAKHPKVDKNGFPVKK